MKSRLVFSILASVFLAASALGDGSGPIAFVDVNVVPMDSERVLSRQTVLVRDGRIESISAASKATLPEGTRRIGGDGRSFLFPGLADMHTHIQEMNDLALYTANGVTTILDMGLAPSMVVINLKKLTEQGVVPGPRVFFALMIDGPDASYGLIATNPDEARAAVKLAKANGYSFIKTYNSVSADVFRAIVDESKRHQLTVIGHGVRSVGLPQALSEGLAMVAHAEEFYYTAFERQTDLGRIAPVVAATRAAGAFVTPNLSTFETISRQWGKPEVLESFLADPRAKHMSPGMRLFWTNMDYTRRKGSIESVVPFLQELTKQMQRAGVPLLTGTDGPVIPGMFPGYAIHEDIAALRRAGLSAYEALSAATRTPGEFIAKYVPHSPRFGTVQVGSKADLILLNANPLLNVETLKSPAGVMSAGRWRDAKELQRIVEAQAEKYRSLAN